MDPLFGTRPGSILALLVAAGLVACTGTKREDTSDFFEEKPDPSDDTTDPLVALDAPLSGETVSGTVSWSATASDDDRVSAVTFLVDGGPVETVVMEPWSGTWDSTAVYNGEHVVSVEAEDPAGNVGTDSLSVLVSNEGGLDPSAVVISNPTADAEICGTVDVEVTASTEVVQVVFTLDGEEMELDTSSPYVWRWDTTLTGEGPHTIMATGTNAEGEKGVDTVAVVVNNDEEACDNTPSVTFDEPLEGEYVVGSQEVQVTASDDGGVVSVAFYVDSGLLTTDTSVPYETTLSSTDFDDGGHTLRAVATDTEGQTGSAEITIIIDNEAPELSITSPDDGDTVQGTVSLSASASDNIGLKVVKFTLDDDDLALFTEAPYSEDLDTTELDYGSYTLTAVAVDLADNETTETIRFNVDNPPVVTYSSPDSTDVSGTIDIAASATDDDRVTGMSLYVDGEVADSTTSDSAVSTTIDTCDFEYGDIIEVEAIAADSGGNITNEPLDLTVNQPLEITIDEISGAVDETQTVGASVGDDQRISRVVWDVDGTTVATSTTASSTSEDCFDCGCSLYSSSFSTASLSEGDHTLTVTATNASGETASASTTITVDYDHDGDGYDSDWYGGDDCDDTDSATSPVVTETCDDVDNDCDGDIDEDFDDDGDGYLDEDACSDGTDCDDTDSSITPVAREDCDGVDDNCDGHIDNSVAWTSTTMTFGASSDTLSGSGMAGSVYVATSEAMVNSFSAWLNPGSSSITLTWAIYEATTSTGDYTLVDSNTTTASGSATWYSSDSFSVELTAGHYYLLAVSSTTSLTRYGDKTPSFSTGGGLTVQGYISSSSSAPTTISTDPSTSQIYYQRVATETPGSRDADADSDGTSSYCGDCDDSDDTVGPDATEICDDQDNDCDGTIDESTDSDGDGEGSCTDCDDSDATAYTGGRETCDEVDNDCDGTVDDNPSDGTTYYKDFDDDGYGRSGTTTKLCEDASGWAAVTGDCDDVDATRSPGLAESCDGIDNDCDSKIDEDFDSDGDGYGAGASCDSDVLDCDDTDATINLDGTEICDSKDNDCDGTTDYGATDGTAYYTDADGDGYGVSTSSVKLCGATTGYSTLSTDCDDSTSAVSPAASETCNEVDDDCDGTKDDGFDADGDGYASCSECDDTDADINPGETETCENGVDDDCDGVDTWCRVSGTNDMGSTGYKLRGEAASDYTGWTVDASGDQNGDGKADVLIGAPANDEGGTGSGGAYIVPGGSVSASSLGGSPAIKLIGEDSSDGAGYAVSYISDQDGDGYDDLLVGGTGIDDGGTDAGAGLMMMGPTTADTDLSRADARLYGVDASDNAGYGLGYAGDTNDDGEPDLWIGAPYADDNGANSGTFYLVLGPTSASMDLSTADLYLVGTTGDHLGHRADSGDTNGDGYSDLLIGDTDYGTSNTGAAFMLLGPETVSGTAGGMSDSTMVSTLTDDYAGSSVVLADVDGDGYDDAVVGAYGRLATTYTDAGVVFVAFGPVTSSMSLATGADYTLSGAVSSAYFGFSASGGDLDEDGYDDLLVGAFNEADGGTSAGMAYVFYGPIDGSGTTASADASYVGEDTDDHFGFSASIGGDINGDGPADLLIGANNEDHTSGTAAGSAYVIYP